MTETVYLETDDAVQSVIEELAAALEHNYEERAEINRQLSLITSALIRRIRDHGRMISEIADYLGVSNSLVSHMVSCKRGSSVLYAEKLERMLAEITKEQEADEPNGAAFG